MARGEAARPLLSHRYMKASTQLLTARDLMQRDILTVSPETPILDVHRLFLEEEIHGAPVLDEDQRVVGIITATDLLRIIRDEYDTSRVPVEDLTAAQAMTRTVISVRPDMPASEVAQLLREQRIHRVLVIENQELLGVVSTFDLLSAFESPPPAVAPGPPRQRGDLEC